MRVDTKKGYPHGGSPLTSQDYLFVIVDHPPSLADSFGASLSGADSNNVIQRNDEDLSVSN